jgi:hypothetical protein
MKAAATTTTIAVAALFIVAAPAAAQDEQKRGQDEQDRPRAVLCAPELKIEPAAALLPLEVPCHLIAN